MTDVQKQLFELQDIKYRDFTSKLVPTVPKEKMIGIRSPAMKKFAKAFSKTDEAAEFIKTLPHEYYEENSLHTYIVANLKDFDVVMAQTERFLPYIDNWATCDGFAPAVFKEHPDEVYEKIKVWIKSDKTYTIRFAICKLMNNYLYNDYFRPEMLDLVAAVKSEEYYVNMMIAWFFATALATQYDVTLPILLDKKLAPWTHNKAIQKAIESYRITPEQKTFLRTLKVKTR